MADKYELKQVKVRLCLAEAEPLYSTEQIDSPDKAVEVMAQALAQLDREYCCVVNLDGAKHPINFNVVSIGDINQASMPMQNVFKTAILSNAANIILMHNHPSGSLTPSKEDIFITKNLIEAGRLMNIPVLDHIIVAGGTAKHFSLYTENPDMFQVRETANYKKLEESKVKLENTERQLKKENPGEDISAKQISFREKLKSVQKEMNKRKEDRNPDVIRNTEYVM